MFPETEKRIASIWVISSATAEGCGAGHPRQSSKAAEQRGSGAAGQRSSGAAEQRSSGAAEQRSSGAAAKCSCVGQRGGAKLQRSIDSHVVDYEA